jgi:hypothetical protein
MNYFPCTISGISTTPHELVYGVKPDLRVLFRLFSTGYFRHLRDGSHHHSGLAASHAMQGIALGRCRKSDGMMFYSPHSKEIYISSDYKLDEGHHTPTAFNLHYDGGIFIGLYNQGSSSVCEPFPEGTSVSMPVQSPNDPSSSIQMRGVIISVPIPATNSALPISDNEASPYVVQYVDGSFHRISPDSMEMFVNSRGSGNSTIRFPSWLGNNQRVMYLHEGTYIKGVMEWNLDDHVWRFSQHRKNGSELFGVVLPNFAQDFQRYIVDGSLIPGWHTGKNFHHAGSNRHVSATSLHSVLPPGSILTALHPNNPDRNVWQDSYKEEYDGLYNNDTYDIISEEEYHHYVNFTGFGLFHLCASSLSKILMVSLLVQRVELWSLVI